MGGRRATPKSTAARNMSSAFMPKLRLDIAVSDERLEQAVEAIQVSARTGQIGDGKIFVYRARARRARAHRRKRRRGALRMPLPDTGAKTGATALPFAGIRARCFRTRFAARRGRSARRPPRTTRGSPSMSIGRSAWRNAPIATSTAMCAARRSTRRGISPRSRPKSPIAPRWRRAASWARCFSAAGRRR